MFGLRLRSVFFIALFVAAAWLGAGYAGLATGSVNHDEVARMVKSLAGDDDEAIRGKHRDDGVTSAGFGGVALAAGAVLVRLRRIAFKLKVFLFGLALAVPMTIALFYATSIARAHA
ncbi:MAG TPA: hypothetical protein VMZ22_11490 [Acidimicrobiales bacterium]|nr:hypothetical protein [Acidimicrobiales bacterium]